jgi:hypothetical protein
MHVGRKGLGPSSMTKGQNPLQLPVSCILARASFEPRHTPIIGLASGRACCVINQLIAQHVLSRVGLYDLLVLNDSILQQTTT